MKLRKDERKMTEKNQEVLQKEDKKIKQEETEKKHDEVVPKQDYDDLEDRYKRILAEFENFKKRSGKDH